MKILVAHNHYQEQGGEDAVFSSEAALLREFGQDVFPYERSNAEIQKLSKAKQFQTLWNMDWSKDSYAQMTEVIKRIRPRVAHFHNIFFMLTPSVYQACRDQGVAVVQSQHNFRLICGNGLFFRDNQICEKCLNKNFWQGVFYRCYRKSFFLSALVRRMLARNWQRGSWLRLVNCYITASEFTRQKYIQAGIPAEQISVKPNFVYPDPGLGASDGKYALFIGRLSAEKGISTLLEAWKSIEHFPLKIVGDGPLAADLKQKVLEPKLKQVEFLGKISPAELKATLKQASFLIVPSLCYESFPRVIAEAFACGIPVVASRQGTLTGLIKEEQNGLLFTAGDPADLAQKVCWLIAHPDKRNALSIHCRREYERNFTAKQNFEQLMEIYERALGPRKSPTSA